MSQRETPQAIKDRLRELWPLPIKAEHIGERLGYTKNAVLGLARRMGLPTRNPTKFRQIGKPPARGPSHKKKYVNTKHGPKLVLTPRREPRRFGDPVPFVPLPKPPGPCRFPLWPDRAGKGHPDYQRFCSKPGRGSWCAEHEAVVYPQAAVSEAA